jgi:RHS repeat-associated protein
MTTWQKFASSGSATTTWKYDGYRGLLTNKVYADGVGPSYTYTSAGRMKSRSWVRAATTTYNMDNSGAVTNVTYSDTTGTPAVTTIMDRLGRPVSIAQGTNIAAYNYSESGLLLTETNSAGLLSSWAIASVYDSLNRRSASSVIQNGTKVFTTNAYDGASRLFFASDGTQNATYTYLTNSRLVSSVVFKSNTTVRLTTTKAYDNLYRLTQISNIPTADTAMVFNYHYNDANQRKAVTNSDGSYWLYGYDNLGQVTSGKRYFSDGIPVPGQQFEYSFDDIGNRKYAGEGGNEWGTGLRYQNYTVNNLNQYTQRTVPNKVDIIGTANASSTVTVNSTPAYRHAEYFRSEVKIGNTTYPQTATLTTVGVLPNGTNRDIVTTNSGTLFVPVTPEIFRYDADGNMTNDGHWILTWDAENRLIALDPIGTLVPDVTKQSLRFGYDHQGRRISKIVSNLTGSAWSLSYSTKFIYDGWNLLAEVNATNNAVLRSFLCGIDASGTAAGAGGVGGFLAIKDSSGFTTTNSFFVYDGNHNVRSLVSAKDGTTTAEYEYDPFGNILKTSGSSAPSNPIRFSTKLQDQETTWNYYGYRYLANGKWVNRDPAGELTFQLAHESTRRGDLLESSYLFVNNEPIRNWDFLGLDVNSPPGTATSPGPFCCCTPSKIAAGEAELRSRYNHAAQYWAGLGMHPDANNVTGISCLAAARALRAFFSPTPVCWQCWVENRQHSYGRGWDENALVCVSRSCSSAARTIVFDWFGAQSGESTPGEPYADFVARYTILNDRDPITAYDTCSEKGAGSAENYAALDSAVPPPTPITK